MPVVAPERSSAPGTYTAVTTKEALKHLVATLSAQKMVSLDTETTGLERSASLVGISLSWEPGTGVYIPVRSPEPDHHLEEATVIEALRPVLEKLPQKSGTPRFLVMKDGSIIANRDGVGGWLTILDAVKKA